ncbi:MAG: hypothetical protein D6814_16140, partial [Calditrichaeota bacterium]
MTKRVAFFCLGLCLLIAPIHAQTISPKSPFICNVDFARFYFDQKSGYLEIYYGFYPDLLTYVVQDSTFLAGAKLITRLIETDTQNMIVNERSSYTIAKRDTNGAWYHHPVTTQKGYVLAFGDFRLQVIAIDSLAPSRRDSVNMRLTLAPTPESPAFSDIELCKNITPSQNRHDLFYKNGMEVLPNPSLVFGAQNHPILFHYVEIYHLPLNKKMKIERALLDYAGNTLRKKSKEKRFQQRNIFDVDKFTVTSWPSGTYYLQYTLKDRQGNALARTRKKFYLYNPHLRAPHEAQDSLAIARLLRDLNALSGNELDREFRRAQYVATDQEIKMFAQLQSEQAKKEFLANFWISVSRGRNDWLPIDRRQYLE